MTEKMSDMLKPCPFCGDPMTTAERAQGWFGHVEVFRDCPIAMQNFSPADGDGWNTRALLASPVDEDVRAAIEGGAAERIDAVAALSPAQLLAQCNYAPGTCFAIHDEQGAHDPCYVVQPGGSMIPLNHWNDELTDVARAVFIVRACNAALKASKRRRVNIRDTARDTLKRFPKTMAALAASPKGVSREKGE